MTASPELEAMAKAIAMEFVRTNFISRFAKGELNVDEVTGGFHQIARAGLLAIRNLDALSPTARKGEGAILESRHRTKKWLATFKYGSPSYITTEAMDAWKVMIDAIIGEEPT